MSFLLTAFHSPPNTNHLAQATRLVLNLRASVSEHDVIDSPDDIVLETRQSSIEFARRSTVSSVLPVRVQAREGAGAGRHILRLEAEDMPG